MSDA
jgi:hypothetical protein